MYTNNIKDYVFDIYDKKLCPMIDKMYIFDILLIIFSYMMLFIDIHKDNLIVMYIFYTLIKFSYFNNFTRLLYNYHLQILIEMA
jgi:hypothetical protein